MGILYILPYFDLCSQIIVFNFSNKFKLFDRNNYHEIWLESSSIKSIIVMDSWILALAVLLLILSQFLLPLLSSSFLYISINSLILFPLICCNDLILLMLLLQSCLGVGICSCPHLTDYHSQFCDSKPWICCFDLIKHFSSVKQKGR